MSLNGRVALVTGTSRGIGRAIAMLLASQGARVIGTEIDQDGADQVTAMFSGAHLNGVGEVLNVNDAERCYTFVEEIEQREGPIGILVNNAGITRDTLIMRMKDEDWASVIDTNLSSVFRLSKAVLRGMMRARWGRIINLSSVVAHMGNPGQVNYAASKAGMEGLSRSLAREVASRGITVNCVAPGFVATDMTGMLNDEQRRFMLSQIPVGRLGTVDDIARVVGFLASESSDYITGTTIEVNGGMYMR